MQSLLDDVNAFTHAHDAAHDNARVHACEYTVTADDGRDM